MKRFTHVFFSVFIVFVVIWSCSSDDSCDKQTWYIDSDNDGFGSSDAGITKSACSKPEGYADNNSDCDDNNTTINPNATEVVNDGIDNNCDGTELIIDPPTTFEVSISEVTASSALISWSESTTNQSEFTLSYSVFLNDELIQGDIEGLSYTINELDYDTNYQLEVRAYVQIVYTTAYTSFATSVPQAPSIFDIEVTELMTTSAQIDWNEATTDADIEIVYDIYINNVLIVEGLDTTSYTLTDLEYGANQVLMLVARHEYGATEVITNFQTLTVDQASFYPISFTANTQIKWAFNYNENNLAIKFDEIYIDNESLSTDGNLNYENGKLASFATSCGICEDLIRSEFTYSNDGFNTVEIWDDISGDFISSYNMTYSTPLSYNIEHWLNGPEDGSIYSYYTIDLMKDSNDRLISYTATDLTNNTSLYTLEFSYDSNNNLVQIIKDNTDVLAINYDQNPNYLGAANNFAVLWEGSYNNQDSSRYNLMSPGNLIMYNRIAYQNVFVSSNDIFDLLKVIPELYSHKNTNNVLSYTLNGNVIKTFSYDYYENTNLPQNIYYEDGSSTFIEYIEVAQ